jgi:hypothetical protein
MISAICIYTYWWIFELLYVGNISRRRKYVGMKIIGRLAGIFERQNPHTVPVKKT